MHATAKWIQADRPFASFYSDSYSLEFRCAFALDRIPDRAALSISGLGFYEAKINGRPVTDRLLTPAFSAYDRCVYYDGYEVAGLLQPGENELTVQLAAGWYAPTTKDVWMFHHAAWRGPLQLIASLTADGECALASGSHWQCRDSRLIFSQLREGETYDASLPEAPWGPCRTAPGPGGVPEKYDGPAVELQRTLGPVSASALPDGTLFDFGANLSGCCEITVRGRRGDRAVLQYAERLSPDGDVDIAHIRRYVSGDRFQRDEYILSGCSEEVWRARFVYHGFRYVKVTGGAELLRIRALDFHTALPEAGGFECDNEILNALQAAAVRSTRTNFHHIPTDCPHREKNGWTGDAHLSCEQALLNFDAAPAYRKWLKDMADAQRPSGALPGIIPTSIWGYYRGNGVCWDCACVVIPWECYMATGDLSFLTDSFPMMDRYARYMLSIAENGVSTIGIGEWMQPEGAEIPPTPALLTAMSAHVCGLMAKICAATGLGDPSEYAAHASEIRAAFRKTFGDCPDSQTFLAMLLRFGLTENPDDTAAHLAQLVRNDGRRLQCGMFGVKYLFEALSDHGEADLAFETAAQTAYPSLGCMLQNGSGTLWEDFEGALSLNHHCFSSVSAWFYRGVAGIRCEEAGYRRVRIAPRIPKKLGFFRAWLQTPCGRLEVCWQHGLLTVTAPAGMEIILDAQVPASVVRVR